MARTLEQDISKIVGALRQVFDEEKRPELAALLSGAEISFEQTSFDNWNGGTYGYTLQLEVPARVYARLGDTQDALENELKARIERFSRLYSNEHVESVLITPSFEARPTEPAASPVEPSFWKKGLLRLFISHASTFKDAALLLTESLADYGVCGFVAHKHIEAMREWEDELRVALTTCDALACLLTAGFRDSQWTDQEIGFAIGRKALIIPVRMGLDPYGFMARYQAYLSSGESASQTAGGLAAILSKHPLTQAKMAEGLVSAFEQSGSFAEARRRAKNLALVAGWNSELALRVRNASKENREIKEAWGVPEIIDRILPANLP